MKSQITLFALCSFFAASLFFSSCRKKCEYNPPRHELDTSSNVVLSTTIVPEEIYSILRLYYDESTNKTTAEALFIYRNPFDINDGARVRLDSWANITFNGQRLEERNQTGRYEREFDGFIPSGDFVWTTWAALTYTNSVEIKPVGLPDLPYSLSSNNYLLPWVGDSLGVGNDAVGLVMQKGPNDFWAATPSDTAIVVDQSQFDKIAEKNKPGWAYLLRRGYPPMIEGTLLGGEIETAYKTKCAALEVLK